MLLLFCSGAKSGTTPPPPAKKTVGWPNSGRRWHDPQELEERLERQRGHFGRRWFDEFVEAQEAVALKIENTEDLEQKTALEQAVAVAYGAVDRAITLEIAPPVYLIEALRLAASAISIEASIRSARMVIEEDEEESAAATLLLH